MYDFWFTLGAATIDPAFITGQVTPVANFQFVDRVVLETNVTQMNVVPPNVTSAASVTVTARDATNVSILRGPSTGLLTAAATTTVRTRIYAYLKSKYANAAPPVGIYTAGRFCQLVKISRFQSNNPASAFKDILSAANAAYIAAINGSPSNLSTFPAVLGLCLMDGSLKRVIKAWDDATVDPTKLQKQSDVSEMLNEFGIVTAPAANDRNWQLVKTFVAHPSFDTAVQFLMAGDSNPWNDQGNTLEQMVFDNNKSPHAIP